MVGLFGALRRRRAYSFCVVSAWCVGCASVVAVLQYSVLPEGLRVGQLVSVS